MLQVRPRKRLDEGRRTELEIRQEARESHPLGIEEVVMDKGYHSGAASYASGVSPTAMRLARKMLRLQCGTSWSDSYERASG
jgi:hypothetical protein